MTELVKNIKDIVKRMKIGIDEGESFVKISAEAASLLFDFGKKIANKECIIISFLLRDIRAPLTMTIEKTMEKIFPEVLEERIKEEKHELVKDVLSFLRRKDLKEISYYKLIDYGTGRVDFERVQSVFEIKSLELPTKEKGLILLLLAKALEEAWKITCAEINEFVEDRIDKLDKSLESIESDKEILNELRKSTEDILYAFHVRALGE